MSKRILNKVEQFLSSKILVDDCTQEEFDAEINKMYSLFTEIRNAKFKPDVDGWVGSEIIVVNKKQDEPFHFSKVRKTGTISDRLRSHAINLSIAQGAIERISVELREKENESN